MTHHYKVRNANSVIKKENASLKDKYQTTTLLDSEIQYAGFVEKCADKQEKNVTFAQENQYECIFRKFTDSEKVTVLSYLDEAYVDLAKHLYITSFARFSISNYLLMATTEETCNHLTTNKINCEYVLKHVGIGYLAKTRENLFLYMRL